MGEARLAMSGFCPRRIPASLKAHAGPGESHDALIRLLDISDLKQLDAILFKKFGTRVVRASLRAVRGAFAFRLICEDQFSSPCAFFER
jgi:hypothetical protein